MLDARLESNPDPLLIHREEGRRGSQQRDGENRAFGSTERGKKSGNIQIQSRPHGFKPEPSQRERTRCILAETSIVTHHHHPGLRVLRCPLVVAVLPETPGPMGQVESTSATTCRLLETGAGNVRRNHAEAGTKTASLSLVGIKTASLSLAEAKDASLNPEGVGTKSTRLSLAGAGTTEATTTKRKGVTEAGASRGSSAESPKAEEHLTGPLADLPHHHPVEAEVEAEVEAGACRMLQLYLIGPARVWLSDLEENTIFCWFDLKKAFENHFRGTYKRPATTDLQACIQKKGETSRSFLTRWLATRNECENVDNRTAMHAFIGGLQRGGLLRHKLTCLVNANKLTLMR
ncbi:hypothetical protein QYE76_070966 [Lolium multiflorum]|uniref:Retrotransposon gag domain-containing protein n=1 Tax=Lolium multiflorum TaxID=4521 RepID=A0AAD8WE51_LOLMU|nr:hypothetical protein QYE76_070966 [Lolium multiflorum]